MFKNRAMQVQMVKTNKQNPETSSTTEGHLHLDFDQISNILKVQVKNAAVFTVGAVVALKLTDAICEIAVNNLTK